MYTQLFNAVQEFSHFTDDELKTLSSYFEIRSIPKNTIILDEGDLADEVYFINKGIIRLYYNKDGEDVTGYLFSELAFAGAYESFLQHVPSTQILETLEDCEVLVLSSENLMRLYSEIPKVNILTRKISEQRFINAQKILTSYITQTPEERYIEFMNSFPNLLNRVHLNIISSFLGITPVSLSRIRKRITEKD